MVSPYVFLLTNGSALMDRNEIEDVLFLYNVANFGKDTNYIWLRQLLF